MGATARLSCLLMGCAYTLHPSTPGFQQRLRLVARAPENYSLHAWDKEYVIGSDGEVRIEVPVTRQPCRVSIFAVPFGRSADPLKQRSISLIIGGREIRRLSIHEISKLPLDISGDHVLSIRER